MHEFYVHIERLDYEKAWKIKKLFKHESKKMKDVMKNFVDIEWLHFEI